MQPHICFGPISRPLDPDFWSRRSFPSALPLTKCLFPALLQTPIGPGYNRTHGTDDFNHILEDIVIFAVSTIKTDPSAAQRFWRY